MKTLARDGQFMISGKDKTAPDNVLHDNVLSALVFMQHSAMVRIIYRMMIF